MGRHMPRVPRHPAICTHRERRPGAAADLSHVGRTLARLRSTAAAVFARAECPLNRILLTDLEGCRVLVSIMTERPAALEVEQHGGIPPAPPELARHTAQKVCLDAKQL